MRAVKYTLLIVESPTIMKSVEALQIPGLEVMNTNGYAWMPVADPKSGKLKARANPDSNKFRKDLKDKALLASSIIIATDSDPSGQFLAHAISAYLGRDERIGYGSLTSIDRESVERLTARPAHSLGHSPDTLARYFTARSLLQRYIAHQTGTDYGLAEVLTAGLLLNEANTVDFITDNGHHYRSSDPLKCKWGDIFKTKPVPAGSDKIWKPVSHPFSTAILPVIEDQRFEETQNSLNRLFTNIPDELDAPLISYPRTGLQGYYAQTWNRLCEQYITEKGADRIKPEAMQEHVKPADGHESLYATTIAVTPHDARPWLKKNELELYSLIHKATVSSLLSPDEVDSSSCFSVNGRTLTPVEDSDSGATQVKAIQSLSGFTQSLFDTGWMKPSGIGKVLDVLVRDGWIVIENGPPHFVLPGSRVESLEGKLRDVALRLGSRAGKLHEIAMKPEETEGPWRRTFADCLQDP